MSNKYSINVLAALMSAFSFSLAAATVPYFYKVGGSLFLLLGLRYIFTLSLSSVLDKSPKKQKTKEARIRLVLISIFQAIFVGSYMYSIFLFQNLSLAVVVIYTFPIITFFANSLVKSRSIDVLSVFALLASLLGIWVMFQSDTSDWNLWGVFWGLFASVAQSFVNILSRHESVTPGWGLIKYIMVLPAVVFVLIYFMTTAAPIASVTAPKLMWGLASAIGMSGGFYFFFHSIAKIGPVRTANVMYMEPVFTIILGVMLLQNVLGYSQWLGMLIILLATISLERWGQKYD
jgi:drug/metabolite transporter (DMT)-like permease